MSRDYSVGSWWAPGNQWQKMPTPAAYQAFWEDPREDLNWIQLWFEHGYHSLYRSGRPDDFDAFAIEVFSDLAGDVDLMVHVSVDGDVVQTFFVPAFCSAAFWVELFPELVAKAKAIGAHEWQVRQARSLIAFIRHGHGEHVIDEDGGQTYEDVERERLAQAARRAAALRKQRGGE